MGDLTIVQITVNFIKRDQIIAEMNYEKGIFEWYYGGAAVFDNDKWTYQFWDSENIYEDTRKETDEDFGSSESVLRVNQNVMLLDFEYIGSSDDGSNYTINYIRDCGEEDSIGEDILIIAEKARKIANGKTEFQFLMTLNMSCGDCSGYYDSYPEYECVIEIGEVLTDEMIEKTIK